MGGFGPRSPTLPEAAGRSTRPPPLHRRKLRLPRRLIRARHPRPAGSADPALSIRDNLLAVANEPGEEILPGQLARGLEILAEGGEVNYVAAPMSS